MLRVLVRVFLLPHLVSFARTFRGGRHCVGSSVATVQPMERQWLRDVCGLSVTASFRITAPKLPQCQADVGVAMCRS